MKEKYRSIYDLRRDIRKPEGVKLGRNSQQQRTMDKGRMVTESSKRNDMFSPIDTSIYKFKKVT